MIMAGQEANLENSSGSGKLTPSVHLLAIG